MLVREAMSVLDQNIWRSCITLETKLRLYNTMCSPDILIRSGDMVDDLDIIEED